MEKCNFCAHRLTEAKYATRDLDRDVQDGGSNRLPADLPNQSYYLW